MNKKVKHLGYLVDTARNAVPTVDTLKKTYNKACFLWL